MAKLNKGISRPWYNKSKAKRDTEHDSFYDTSAWRKFRYYVLSIRPLCVECHKNDKVVQATVVDHIKPIKEGGERLSISNTQPLCDHHHAIKSQAEGKNKPRGVL